MATHQPIKLRPPIASTAWKLAQAEAASIYHDYLGTEHVLIALTRAVGGYTERLLQQIQRRPEDLRAELRRRAGPGMQRYFSGHEPEPTPRLARALAHAQEEASANGQEGLGERELLLAILRSGQGVAVRVLAAEGPAIEDIIALVEADNGPEATDLRMRGGAELLGGLPPHLDREAPGLPPESPSGTPMLDRYGRDLTAAAKQGKLREAIGRQKEQVAIGEALARQERNVPVLVGEAGVGKTAIVEGFALRLSQEAERPVVPALRGKRLVELRLADVVAGGRYQGDFEERIQRLLRECADHPEVILFIDEIHTLVGAGHHAGNQDAAQILKPALARGELRVIGASTPAEYQRYIARDAALERRMQLIRVEEPSPEDAEELLRAVAPRLAARHHVQIPPETVHAAVELTVRYQPDRFLPDKAIDVLDVAAARVVVGGRLSFIEDLDLTAVQAAAGGGGGGVVTPALVAKVVAEQSGIPESEITPTEQDRLLFLEQTLRRRVMAQDEAVAAVAQAIKVSRIGLRDPNRPRAVLLFAGPTGVGKTETAKALAEALFGGGESQHLLRLDMGEFRQEHAQAQLIGAPPGYVGYDQEGRLTGWLRRNPYSVVLFDEIEKAHPAVLDLLLGLFDAGRITDAQGRTHNGREAVYILTTNLLSLQQLAPSFAPGERDRLLRYQLTHPEDPAKAMRPELVNRLDRIIVFRPLDAEALESIAQLQIDRIADRLRGRGVGLRVEADARAWLVEHGTDPASGARALARALDDELVARIADHELRGALVPGVEIMVTLADGALDITVTSPK